jgi:hypothetical protein
MRRLILCLTIVLGATGAATSQDIKIVEQNLNHAGQDSIRDYKMSCPSGYTPMGLRIVSNRLLGHFKDIPSGEVATIEFFDWAGLGSQASTIITLICKN